MPGGALTAATIVNEWSVEDIANALYEYGDETRSRQIARDIVIHRPFTSTAQLAEAIGRKVPWAHRPQTLARCFQALRIVVNDEMGALEDALDRMHEIVKPGTRLIVCNHADIVG